MWIQSGAVLGYAACLPEYVGWGPVTVISILAAIAWSAANFWEVRLIGADLKMIAAVRRLSPGGDDAAD